MKTPPTARIVPAIALLAAIGWNHAASADLIKPLYSVTDLGAGYQLRTDANGHASAVVGANGSAYAFDKAPVTSIDIQYVGGNHADDYTKYTLQEGSYQVGYRYDHAGGLMIGINYPTFTGPLDGWGMPPYLSPVSDINSHGQAVGTGLLNLSTYNSMTFAAFTSPLGTYSSYYTDNLNNYTTTYAGLTSSLKIDDLGRIIATSGVEDYLLTPLALGPAAPMPTPEPTTLALLAVASAGFAIHRRFGRRRIIPT